MADKRITDLSNKVIAAATDIVPIVDPSDNTTKRTTVLGLAGGIFTKAVDANGWTVFDNGVWKEYEKRFTGGVVGGSGAGGLSNVLSGLNMPSGVSPSMGIWSVSVLANAYASQASIMPELDYSSASLTYTWACHAYRHTGGNLLTFAIMVRGRV